jgi:hypothetical protein
MRPTGLAMLVGRRPIETREGREHPFSLFSGDADTVVVNVHPDLLTGNLGTYPDACTGVLDGVAKQIGDRVWHAPAIKLDA